MGLGRCSATLVIAIGAERGLNSLLTIAPWLLPRTAGAGRGVQHVGHLIVIGHRDRCSRRRRNWIRYSHQRVHAGHDAHCSGRQRADRGFGPDWPCGGGGRAWPFERSDTHAACRSRARSFCRAARTRAARGRSRGSLDNACPSSLFLSPAAARNAAGSCARIPRHGW